MADLSDLTLIAKGILSASKTAATAAQATANGLGALAKGNVGAEAITEVTAKLGGMIPIVGNFSGALQGAATAAIGMARDLQAGTQYGVYFQENIAEFGKTVLQARDSMESWQARLEKSASSFNQLGLGMDASMKAFGNMAKQLQDTPLAMQLEATGIKAEELNDVLALSISARKFADFTQERTSQIAINSALNLSKEMDDLARFTGLSRKQQQEQLEAEIKKPDVAAMLMAMTEEQAASFLEASSKLGAQAENVRDLFAEYATGGMRTEQGGATAAALEFIDPRINKMMEESARLSQSGSEEDRKRSAELSAKVGEMISGSLTPEKLKQIAVLARSGDQTAEALNKIITETKSLGADRAAQMEVFSRQQKGEFGLTVEDVKREMAGRVKAEREAEPTEETGVFRGVTGLDRFGKDLAAIASTELPRFNEAVGGVTKELFGMQGALRARTVAEMETEKEGAYATIKESFARLKEEPAEVMKEVGSNVYDGAKTGIKEGLEYLGVPGTWINRGSEAVDKAETAIEGMINKLPGREGGTSKATGGNLLEDWGKESLVKLHGREGVITEDQLAKMHENTQAAIGAMGKSQSQQQSRQEISVAPVEVSQKSIESLMSVIKGPTDDLGKRLEKLSSKDIDKIMSNDVTRRSLDDEISTIYAGKPMIVDPIISRLRHELRPEPGTSKEQPRVEKFPEMPPEMMAYIDNFNKNADKRVVGDTTIATMKLSDETTRNLKDSISKSSDEYKSLTSELVGHGIKTQSAIAEHTKTAQENSSTLVQISKQPKETAPAIESPPKASGPDVFDKIGNTFSDMGNFIGKQISSVGNAIISVPNTVNESIKMSQTQVQNTIGSIGSTVEKTTTGIANTISNKAVSTSTSFEDSLKRTISGLGVTPMMRPAATPVTGSYSPYTRSNTQASISDDQIKKTLASLGSSPIKAESKAPVYDLSDPFTKMALEQAKILEKTFSGKTVVKTVERQTEKNPVTVKVSEPKKELPPVVGTKPVETKKSVAINEESIKGLLAKASEKRSSGDEKAAKIYEESAKRLNEKISKPVESSKSSVPKSPVSVLGPGADIAAIKALRESLPPLPVPPKPKASVEINESKLKEPAKKVRESEQSVVTTSVKEKASMPKTADLEKIVAAPKPAPVKKEEKVSPVVPMDQTTMSDLKTELVELNKNMRILIAHTDEVADNSKKQVRATQQSSTNNILG